MSDSSSHSRGSLSPGGILFSPDGTDAFAYDPNLDPWIGQILGNYRLLQRIGEGATAIVYRAEHVQLGRIYALKILHPMIATRPGMRERFLREAQTVAQLEHENIIFINDFAIDPQLGPYMVMEYLQGHTLKDVLETHGPQPLPLVLSISLQVCRALATAHRVGIIHRDLKPENIFLEQRENQLPHVKILDFGIARLTQNTSSITGDGKLIGTPLYMSPEQCRGQFPLTPASDVYSFGIMLYEMLTGHPPFQSESPHKLIIDHFLAIPPDLDFSFPEELRQLQRELLAKEPTERPQDFVILAKRLREAIEQTQSGPTLPVYSTLEDEPIPALPQQIERDLLYPTELPVSSTSDDHPNVAASVSVSPVQNTVMYHPAIPDSRDSLYSSAPSREKTSTQIPRFVAPETPNPVVVKRGTAPLLEPVSSASDPLLNDLEQLFSAPDLEKLPSSPLSATAWEIAMPSTVGRESTYIPQSPPSPDAVSGSFVESSRHTDAPLGFPFQIPMPATKTPPRPVMALPPQTPSPRANAQTPPPFPVADPHEQTAHFAPSPPTQSAPSPFSAALYSEPSSSSPFSSDASFSHDVTQIARNPRNPPPHPSGSHSASIPVFAPKQQRPTGQHSTSLPFPKHSMTPQELEQVLFHQDAVTEIDLSRSPARTRTSRKTRSARNLWLWVLLIVVLALGFSLFHLLQEIPVLPPLLLL